MREGKISSRDLFEAARDESNFDEKWDAAGKGKAFHSFGGFPSSIRGAFQKSLHLSSEAARRIIEKFFESVGESRAGKLKEEMGWAWTEIDEKEDMARLLIEKGVLPQWSRLVPKSRSGVTGVRVIWRDSTVSDERLQKIAVLYAKVGGDCTEVLARMRLAGMNEMAAATEHASLTSSAVSVENRRRAKI